jgi:hypothetical protein
MRGSRSSTPALCLTLCLVAASMASARVARAQDAKECASAYVAAQNLRAQSQLRASRERLLVCSSDACAVTLRVDCVQWLKEVEAAMPTVVFAVQGADGKDLSAVRVTMDGASLGDHVGGAAMPVDPGTHAFRFESEGTAPIDEQVVVREGEKARVIRAKLGADASTAKPAGASTFPYLLGGGGVVLAGLGSTFEILGLSKRSDYVSCVQQTCGATTASSIKTTAQTDFVAGDLLLGAGIVAVGVAAYLYFSRGHASGTHDETQHALVLTLLPGGGIAGLGGRF